MNKKQEKVAKDLLHNFCIEANVQPFANVEGESSIEDYIKTFNWSCNAHEIIDNDKKELELLYFRLVHNCTGDFYLMKAIINLLKTDYITKDNTK